jgi:phenylacetate-CoA ligase
MIHLSSNLSSPSASPIDASSALYAWAYRRVLFPTWQRVARGRPIRDHLAVLESTQWLPREELEELQLASLRALLTHAGHRVPYWRTLFKQVGFDARDVQRLADVTALPVLTREIIHDRFDELVDPELHPTNIRKGTSGTTGVPLSFEYCNESEAWRQATRIRGYAWAGLHLGLPTVHYWGAGAGVPDGLKGRKMRLDRAMRREVYVDAAKQDEASMQSFARVLTRRPPWAIVAYTQALSIFARWAIENEARDWPDLRVVCAAEPVLPLDRSALVEAFGPHVFETYGSRETMLVAAECEAQDGMHIAEENLLVEVTRDGAAVGAGESGDVLVTDLHNFGMPFIRYANGDVATYGGTEACSCGRSLRKLTRVDGRRVDILHDAAGQPVSGMVFISLLQCEKQMLRAFQVVQKKSGEVELRVVRAGDFDEKAFDGIVRRLTTYFGGLPLHVTFCDEIPASPAGKRRPIVVES